MSKVEFKPGDILIARISHADKSGSKERPVLILSEKDQQDDYIVLKISSILKDDPFSIILALPFLPKKSCVKLNKVYTINKKRLAQKIGHIDKSLFKKIIENFKNQFK